MQEETIESTQKKEEPEVQNSTEPQVEDKCESKKDKKKKDKHAAQDEKVQELGEKLNELNEKYLRLYSEYENYRKRTNGEKSELILNGGKDVIKSVLPIVDDLERALQAMAAEDPAKEGVQLILNKMLSILQQKGLKPMDAKGQKFDENLHEAVTQFPAASEDQKGLVMDVIEKGYFLNDKVLRYAKVVVAI